VRRLRMVKWKVSALFEQPVLSRQVVHEDPLQIARDHSQRPLGNQEHALIWHHRALPGVELFRGSYRTYGFARHYHSVPAIGVVDRGVMGSFYGRTNYVVPTGSVILLNPGDVHAPGPANGEGWSFRTFFLEDVLFRSRTLAIGIGSLRFTKPFVEDQWIADSLLRLHHKLEQSGASLEFESTLLDILAHIAERHVCVPAPAHSAKPVPLKVKRAKEYIEAFYPQDLTLERLAGVAGLSTYHLLRAFRNTVGLTPHTYLIQMRIEAAKRLLLSGATLSAVAAKTGFADQSHFNRHFKRIAGVTPGQYHPDFQKSFSLAR
jgi:AraC-like DNA-binding protein